MVIGITGGVGSGKSTFAALLKKKGWAVLDVDQLARELTDHDTAIQDAIRKRFGASCFDENGVLKRRKLGKMVFSVSGEREALNAIIWPQMIRKLEHLIHNHLKEKPDKPLLVDIAVLFEAKLEKLFDHVIVVTANKSVRRQRLKLSRGWTDQEIEQRINSQIPDSEKIRKSDFIIENSGSRADLEQYLHDFIKSIMKEHG